MANNLGTTSDSWERQVEAGASGVPQDLGKLRGHARRRARPARRAEERTDLGWNPKGRSYPNQARLGGIDKMEGREEMSARRTPKWASRPIGKVSIPIVRKRDTRFERQLRTYNSVL